MAKKTDESPKRKASKSPQGASSPKKAKTTRKKKSSSESSVESRLAQLEQRLEACEEENAALRSQVNANAALLADIDPLVERPMKIQP